MDILAHREQVKRGIMYSYMKQKYLETTISITSTIILVPNKELDDV